MYKYTVSWNLKNKNPDITMFKTWEEAHKAVGILFETGIDRIRLNVDNPDGTTTAYLYSVQKVELSNE